MASPKTKHLRITTDPQVQRKLGAEKRGRIDGEYKPFLLIHDFSSHGRVSRIKYEQREVHLMSDLETALFHELLWHPSVVKICEQVPLETTSTLEIADEMGVAHPKLTGDGKAMPLTTDFVVDFEFAGDRAQPEQKLKKKRRAIAVKPVSQLQRPVEKGGKSRYSSVTRTIDKLEIERRYWSRLGVEWFLVTDAELCKVRKQNIERILSVVEPSSCHDPWMCELDEVLRLVLANPNVRLMDLRSPRNLVDGAATQPLQDAIRFLCKHRYLEFDMSKELKLEMLAGDFWLGERLVEAAASSSSSDNSFERAA